MDDWMVVETDEYGGTGEMAININDIAYVRNMGATPHGYNSLYTVKVAYKHGGEQLFFSRQAVMFLRKFGEMTGIKLNPDFWEKTTK